MKHLFVDTSGWACYFDRAQPAHHDAFTFVRLCLANQTRLVTTNYIIAELVALLHKLGRPRAEYVSLIDELLTTPEVEVVHIDPTLHRRGWALLSERIDKPWSLVDCVSFVILQDRGLTEALTTDHHFEQAGFSRLLKP